MKCVFAMFKCMTSRILLTPNGMLMEDLISVATKSMSYNCPSYPSFLILFCFELLLISLIFLKSILDYFFTLNDHGKVLYFCPPYLLNVF